MNKKLSIFNLRKLFAKILIVLYRFLHPLIHHIVPDKIKLFFKEKFFDVYFSPRWDKRLWYGFSHSALLELHRIKADTNRTLTDRANASYNLSCWYDSKEQYKAALQEINYMKTLHPRCADSPYVWIPETMLLSFLDQPLRARALLEGKKKIFNPDIELLLANTWNNSNVNEISKKAEKNILAHINNIYTHFGLRTIKKRIQDKPLSIDNLCGTRLSSSFPSANKKVSIILSAFNAEKTIITALQSLSEQSWDNIEILVVDDASTDNTVEKVTDYSLLDKRVKIIRQKENRGTYYCRNTALTVATGDYVTTHDSDDWSHPDKVRLQVKNLIDTKSAINASAWTRVTPALYALFGHRLAARLISPNYSSFMFPKSILHSLGGWDGRVRIEADSSFFRALKECYNLEKIENYTILEACPLSFGRVLPKSLTKSYATHISTLQHGVRREYHDATNWWYRKTKLANNEKTWKTENLNFHTPSSISSKVQSAINVDCLFITDLHSTKCMLVDAILKSKESNLQCAIFHYPDYENSPTEKPIRDQIRDFAWKHDTPIIAPGETVHSRLTIALDPRVFKHSIDRFPIIHFEELLVVTNQDSKVQPDLKIKENLMKSLKNEGTWISVSELNQKIINLKGSGNVV
jgi:glycosyltransferase involved in cell wall biosynthesis